MVRQKVSVIIPVYRVSAYVERCLRSVMEQSYSDIECIIVDDKSDDNSVEKCKALIAEYNENEDKNEKTKGISFRIIHHEHNRGLSAARNTGTIAAKGEYLYYLDSDDYISPDCIEKLTTAVNENPSIEMVQGNTLMTSNGKEGTLLYNSKHSVFISNNDEARKAFYKDRFIYISVWNKLIKRSFVEECQLYCREGLVFEDLLWVFYLIKHLKTACLCEEVTYYYCIRSGSISTAARPESVRCYTAMFDEILHNLTAGKERVEIEGYLYYFIRRYVSYVKIVPAFKETLRLYKEKARQYSCWYVYSILTIAGIVGGLGNPLGLLDWMNNMRWKNKRLLLRIRSKTQNLL